MIDDDYYEDSTNDNDGDANKYEVDKDVSLNDQDAEAKSYRAGQLKILSDPRRIRIRPRVMRQVRRFVRKPLEARRRRKSRQSRRKSQNGR